jgi:hypothetical protein
MGKAKRSSKRPPVSSRVPSFPWTPAKEEVARLLAEGDLSDKEVAIKAGVVPRSLRRWKDHPEFMRRVGEYMASLQKAGLHLAIAKKESRVKALDQRWALLEQVRQERGADPDMQAIPGGKTGLLVRRIRGIGTGDNFREVEEFELDAALLTELRNHERQAAQELGQWEPEGDKKGKGDGSAAVQVIITLPDNGRDPALVAGRVIHPLPALPHKEPLP